MILRALLAALALTSCAGSRRAPTSSPAPAPTVVPEPAEPDDDEAVRITPCGRLRSAQRCLVGGIAARGRAAEEARFEERPPHALRVGTVAIDRREVTLRQWRACVRAGRCAEPSCAQADERAAVRCVSWEEARGFCAFRRARLPTEAEWERAAAGLLPAHRAFPWGDALPDAGAPVDRTEDDVRDLGGGVAEWTDDGGDFYPSLPELPDAGPDAATDAAMDAPPMVDGLVLFEDVVAPAASPWRVVRGGDDRDRLADRTSTRRRFRQPGDRLPWVGLRCVYDPQP